jgi:hypothetical protein
MLGPITRLAQKPLATLAFATIAGLLASAPAQAAEDFDASLAALNRQIMAKPANIEANLAYARRAEEIGQARKALVAYERILMLQPGHEEALAGYARMRWKLQPEWSNVTVEAGVTSDGNAWRVPDLPFSESVRETIGWVGAQWRDERMLFDHRWRTRARAYHEWHDSREDGNSGFISIESGPIFPISSSWSMYIMPSLVGSWVQTSSSFGDFGLILGIEGYLNGALQTVEARVAWRDYNADLWFRLDRNGNVRDGAFVIDILGRFNTPDVFTAGDVFTVLPRVRWTAGDTIERMTEFGPGYGDPLFGDRITTLDAMLGLEYSFPIATDVTLTPNLTYRYSNIDANYGVVRQKITDQVLAPGMRLTFSNVFRQGFDIKFDYRYEYTWRDFEGAAINSSNVIFNDFTDRDTLHAHIFGARVAYRY